MERGQTISIKLSQEFLKDFNRIESKAEKGDGEACYLLKIINKGMSKLASGPEAGQHIPRKLWPEHYVRKYGINNPWRLRLDSYWRMIYTIGKEEIELFCIILEVMDHKKYDRRFGYRKG